MATIRTVELVADQLPMDVEVLRTVESLEPLVERWRELAEGMPFRQPEWLLSWWQHFRTDTDELFVLVVRDRDGSVRAVAPWYLNKVAKAVRFLGDGSVCTDHCSLLIDAQCGEDRAVQAMARYMCDARGLASQWKMLHFEAVDCRDPAMTALAEAMQALGSKLSRSNPANTWTLDISEGWEKYLQSVSRKSRNKLRSRARALDGLQVRWVRSQADLTEFMPVLVELHQKRRNALGEPGCFADPRFEGFLRQASAQLLDRHQLQAFSIWLGNRPIAADIGFRDHTRWLCYQTGIDPEAMELEPGKLANIAILRSAEKSGITAIDFLRGDEPYKPELRAYPCSVLDLRLLQPGLAGAIRHTLWEAEAAARSVLDAFRRRFTAAKP